MNRLVRRLAKQYGVTPAKAADQIDGVVYDVLRKLKEGQSAKIPGLGSFSPGENEARFKPEDPGER